MKTDLSHNERMVEDGHARRSPDLIADDKSRLVGIMAEFIALANDAARFCKPEDVEDAFIAAEENFADMLAGAWGALNEEDNSDDTLPISERRKAWLLAQAEKYRKPLRAGLLTNPATLRARGEA